MYKILIADDEALMRKGLCTLIDWAKLGCQIVGTAENGLQAKQAVLDYQPADTYVDAFNEFYDKVWEFEKK